MIDLPRRCALIGLMLCASGASAGPLEQAKRMHDRLTGVPPTPAVLAQMGDAISNGHSEQAAYLAMEDSNFYNVTLKQFAAPWTNIDQSAFVPLNDYIATVIGMIRDDYDFRELLYADRIYLAEQDFGQPPYALDNNRHYEVLEQNHVDLKSALVERPQSQVTGLPAEATAGVVTSRAAAQAFFIDGTNRAMFRFTLMNHMCRDLEQIKDNTRVPDRIRQDVSRSPGGDSRIFLNNCMACHAGMDPLAQAYAYYDFVHDVDADPEGVDGFINYNSAGQTDPATGSRVKRKYHINANNFIYGFATPDDQWENYWREGPNKLLGWDPALPGKGAGAKSMGMELAHSEAFASCQVDKVFKAVCLRPVSSDADRLQVADMLTRFKGSGYQMKQAFADAAVYCMGE